jgi:hypothetical protein
MPACLSPPPPPPLPDVQQWLHWLLQHCLGLSWKFMACVDFGGKNKPITTHGFLWDRVTRIISSSTIYHNTKQYSPTFDAV